MTLFERLTGKMTRVRLRDFLVAHVEKNRKTLDIGCANSPYRTLCEDRVGIDIAPGPGVDVVADAHTLPFPNEHFEQILCTEVLEHFYNPVQAIGEMHRVLKPGGKLILTTRFLFPLHDVPHDYFRYTKYGLQHLLKAWSIERIEEEVTTIETIAVLLQRIGYQTRLRLNRVSKVGIFLLARLISWCSALVVEEYGDITRTQKESPIMTSGYYVVAWKLPVEIVDTK